MKHLDSNRPELNFHLHLEYLEYGHFSNNIQEFHGFLSKMRLNGWIYCGWKPGRRNFNLATVILDYKSRSPWKSDAIENSYYSMLIKKIMDLIKVNGEVACAIKNAVKAKNAGLGEKITLESCVVWEAKLATSITLLKCKWLHKSNRTVEY